jgi:DHA2 family multidrug resistance protein
VRSRTIDYIGIALLAMSVGSIQYLLEHGQREDWFDSRLIVVLAVIGGVTGLLLVWREFATPSPAVDFRVLRHRPMWVGTLLGVVMGVGLYASVFTLPVFLQGNLRMTAMQTGIVLLPGAMATAASMALAGRLNRRVDPRILIASGALTFAFSMWRLAQITSDSGAGDFFWPLILRGLGLGMMFVPLTTLTLAELSSAELPQGTGLYNFFRQLGGSFGIAVIATMLTHYSAQFHSVLVEHLHASDPVVAGRMAMITQGLMGRGIDAATAHAEALTLIDREVTGQASVIAYSRIYWLAAFINLALVPMLLLVKRPKGSVSGVIAE